MDTHICYFDFEKALDKVTHKNSLNSSRQECVFHYSSVYDVRHEEILCKEIMQRKLNGKKEDWHKEKVMVEKRKR